MSKYRCLTRELGSGVSVWWNFHASAKADVLGAEVFAHGFHFGQGVLVVGAVGGGDAFVEAGQGFFGAALFCEGLRGHLVGGDVVGVVLDEDGEFGECGFSVAVGGVFHGEAVAGEGVGGVKLEDFVQGCDLVHVGMVRFAGWVCKPE
jgi:hypothetical protein